MKTLFDYIWSQVEVIEGLEQFLVDEGFEDEDGTVKERFKLWFKYQDAEEEKLAAYLEYCELAVTDLPYLENKLQDVQYYEEHTYADLAELFVDEGMFGRPLPEWAQNHIDYESLGHDLWRDYDIFEPKDYEHLKFIYRID